MENEIEKSFLDLLKNNPDKRRAFFEEYLLICESNDIMHFSNKLDEYKRDFFSLLPNEIIQLIIQHLDWQTLLKCCLVSRTWNHKISNIFNKHWYDLCLKHLPLNLVENSEYCNENTDEINYKQIFVQIMKKSTKLENGDFFRPSSFAPVEIEALATYKNIIATACHKVKFWKLENNKWDYSKTLQLQSRAQNFNFNDKYLVSNTYFLTIDLYSLEEDQFIYQFMGHTCSVTCFNFDNDLNIIVSGSADNTVKIWPMISDEPKQSIIQKAIKSYNLIWPVKVKIEKLQNQNEFMIIVLCANSICYLNLIEKIDDFKNGDESNLLNVYNFRHKIQISDTINSYINLEEKILLNECDDDDNDNEEEFLISNKSWIDYRNGILSLFLVTDNNAYRQKKTFIRQYKINKNSNEQAFDIEYISSKYNINNDEYLNFINQRYLELCNVRQFEIISFGFNFCLFIDENNNFYLANLKKKLIQRINIVHNIDNTINKFYRILSNNIQDQFILYNKIWLNGFKLNSKNDLFQEQDFFSIIFYSNRRNEVFLVEWKF